MGRRRGREGRNVLFYALNKENRENDVQRKILIIDDSEDDILLTKMVLTRISGNFIVESALSGKAGLELLRTRDSPHSLILLDLKMAGMGGLDVLHAIRADEHLRGIPVVIVTHSELELDREACTAGGANSFLNKSVDLDRFMTNIRNELGKWLGNG